MARRFNTSPAAKSTALSCAQRAQKMGLTLNEYGLREVDTRKASRGATEEEIYEKLGLALDSAGVARELRRNRSGGASMLPKLVELAEIRGDLHMHTTETDGRATLEEMAEAAHAAGLEYIAITDHSKALAMANGLDEKRAVAFAHQVRDMDQRRLGMHVFSGIECDIRRDGSMDLEDDALGELDLVIGSVHSHMNLEASEMTDRLLRALECPHLRVLGHPTGRILLHRDPYPFDFEAGRDGSRAAQCLSRNQRQPRRLDLTALADSRRESPRCKFVISTDAHHPKHLANMRYGVRMARRGWLEAADIMNTLPADEFARGDLKHK